ncbi:MAG: hypothetical protein GEU99_19730 [Luteitalea sp.]|nr:hypothetical protein [Luteitalea sp.]
MMLRAIALALLALTLTQTAILPPLAQETCAYSNPNADDCAPDCAACLCCAVTRVVAPEIAAVLGDAAVSSSAPPSCDRGTPLVDPREIPHIPKA